MCPVSQQKGFPCHLCQVAVSVVGKILQDNCTVVSHGRGAQGWCFPLSQLPHGASSALSPPLLPQEKMRLFLDKKCQYLPFQDWSVKCKKMVDTGMLVLVQLGKQVLVTGGDTPPKTLVWDVWGLSETGTKPL